MTNKNVNNITDEELQALEQKFQKKLKNLEEIKKLEKKYPWFIKFKQRLKKEKNLREKKPYFLDLEFTTKSFFYAIICDGVKIVVPIEGQGSRFYRLNTEKDFVFHETKPDMGQKILSKRYKEHNVFYMNEDFQITDKPDKDLGVVAYVCIYKKDKEYTKAHRKRINFIEQTLKNYCYQTNNWDIFIINRFDTENYVEFHSLSYSDSANQFMTDDEKWFKKCRTKYGITQHEINIAKSIIKIHRYKFDDIRYTVKSKTLLNNDIWCGVCNK